MGLGTLGALGAAVNTLGRGVKQYGEKTYSEELNKKLEAAKEAKAEALRTRQEEFQVKQEETRQTNAVARMEKAEELRVKGAKGTKKEQNYTLKDEVSGEQLVAKYSYKDNTYTPTGDPDAAPIPPEELKKYSIGLVKSVGQTDAEYNYAEKIQKDYNKEYALLEKEAVSVAKLKSQLKSVLKDNNSYTSEAIKNSLASVFSNGSQSIKEVTRWSNVGTLPERFGGALTGFFAGTNLDVQYKKGLEMVEQYERDVLMPRKENMDSYYTEKVNRTDFIQPKDILRNLIIEVPDLPGSFVRPEDKEPLTTAIPTRDEIIEKIEAEGSRYRDQKDIDAVMSKFDYEKYTLPDVTPNAEEFGGEQSRYFRRNNGVPESGESVRFR